MSLFPEVDKEIEDIKKLENDKVQELKNKSVLYFPSNGIEGDIFENNFCSTCSKDNQEKDIFCRCIGLLLSGENCSDIINYKGKIMCLKHDDFSIKSYMGVEL